MKPIISKVLRYLLQGIVIVSPFLITFGLAYYVFDFIDRMIPGVPRGIGFIIVIAVFILIGYWGSKFFLGRLVLDIFDRILEKIPGLKIVYTAVKDFAEGFVGDNRKFKSPVLVTVNEQPMMERIGFITQSDLSSIGYEEKIMVYVPHSYNFSGNMFVVDRKNVTILDMDAGDAMKLAVTGGVAGFNDEDNKQDNV